ncbi:hypothetical protein GCM10007940_08090 [Portibacter lacus]|uniref:Uncharacterized protein n=2 Tax=Portibacter lacus TaxID=1099794 RepID=A0AA37SNA4_9BACT|nr:hypothetical protein GCM10007940_08090 [Portibacter lacus]
MSARTYSMKQKIKLLWITFVVGTLIPLLIIIPLSFIGWFENSSGTIAFVALICIIPLVLYYYFSNQIIEKGLKEDNTNNTILSITFYVNFLIYMIATLIAFNLIIIGGFLVGGDVPMGMELVPSQIPYLIGGGTYLLIISILGMIYLSQSKKLIRSKKF